MNRVAQVKTSKALSVVCLIMFSVVMPAAAQSQSDRLARVVAEAGISGSIIVTRAGETVIAAGYGMANYELGIPNAPDTKFRIGSITKQFTSTGILILQERGSLDVLDPVGKHVKAVPESWRSITIHQLLTHTSGIMHSWALPGFSESMAVPTTLDKTLEQFFDQPLLFEPGTGFTYSGVGYFLLAKIIEVVSGMSYSEFLHQEIFGPLGMEDTGADDPREVIPNRALGYKRSEDGAVTNAPAIFMPILTGGGNLYSTVEDMALWDRALAEHRLLSEQSFEALYRVERKNYAYGWVIQSFDDRRTLFHAGGVPGFSALNIRVPSEELDIVILTNLTPAPIRTTVPEIIRMVLSELDHVDSSF